VLAGAQDNEANAVKAAEKELRAPQYSNIYDRYSRQMIEMKTTEMANSDLTKYHTV
jgi:hypothetical protein